MLKKNPLTPSPVTDPSSLMEVNQAAAETGVFDSGVAV